MTSSVQPAWLRGAIDGISPLLQPVAHALVDADEDVQKFVPLLTQAQIAERVGGTASVAYHVMHAIGSLDRLLTYARGESLNETQLATHASEKAFDASRFNARQLAADFHAAVERAHTQLRATTERELPEQRLVGRAKLPSTTFALLFHAAEHTARHVGQMVTTAKIVASSGAR